VKGKKMRPNSEPELSRSPTAPASTLPRRLGASAAAMLMLLAVALAGCDNNASADGNATGNGARGHVKLGIPF